MALQPASITCITACQQNPDRLHTKCAAEGMSAANESCVTTPQLREHHLVSQSITSAALLGPTPPSISIHGFTPWQRTQTTIKQLPTQALSSCLKPMRAGKCSAFTIQCRHFVLPRTERLSLHGVLTCSLHISFNFLIFGTWYWMNFCPPKPGFTDMISTRSATPNTCSTWLRGVAGFKTTPALQPRLLICEGAERQNVNSCRNANGIWARLPRRMSDGQRGGATPHLIEHPVEMDGRGGFAVNGNDVRPSLREVIHALLRLNDHLAQEFANVRGGERRGGIR